MAPAKFDAALETRESFERFQKRVVEQEIVMYPQQIRKALSTRFSTTTALHNTSIRCIYVIGAILTASPLLKGTMEPLLLTPPRGHLLCCPVGTYCSLATSVCIMDGGLSRSLFLCPFDGGFLLILRARFFLKESVRFLKKVLTAAISLDVEWCS
ncbi:hypothetical protein AVEN_165528-1 [Araneus ventricosus]|uniref:Uncharacterized protein n=1 Tax=Araneus ventricosus TaxID=182803 RepID=A0A4Y2V2Z1_ARAVE|nr:hypothetical protein AVEN_1360-1 [Araneus ventricosus]GBO19619.1 hypothetical protein AVEN_165528-1 [Araneus ventricosus]